MKFAITTIFLFCIVGCASRVRENSQPGHHAQKIVFVSTNGIEKRIDLTDIESDIGLQSFTVKSNPAYNGATKKYKGFKFV